MSEKELCEYSRKVPFILAHDVLADREKETEGTLCLSCNYSPEINFDASGNPPTNDVQRDFLLAAEKYLQDLDMIARQENGLLIKMKETLPQEAKHAVYKVKFSMEMMHRKYAKQLDAKLNDLTTILTRIEHEMQDIKQWEHTDEESYRETELFLQTSTDKKERIESMIEETVSALNLKRQNDERLFSEFSKSINQQVQHSLQALEQCLHNTEIRRKNRANAKISELKQVLQDLKKFG